MGLLTGYMLYRSGRKRAERKAERERLREEADTCTHCGFPEFMHSPDERKLCPKF